MRVNRRLLSTSLALFILSAVVAAQGAGRVQVAGPSPGVVRLGEDAALELRIQNPGAEPQAPRLPEVDGLQLLLGRPQSMRQESIIGRQRRVSVTYTWPVRLRPERVGDFVVPPFDVDTGGGVERVGPLRISCIADVRGAEFSYLDVQVTPRRVYVNEPFDVRLDFGVDERLRTVTRNVRTRTGEVTVFEAELRADWIDALDGAVLQDSDRRDGVPTQVNGMTLNGELRGVPTEVGYQRAGGESFVRFVLDRRFLPTRSGMLELGKPVLRFSVAQGRDRIGLFGERVPGRTEDLFAYGEAQRIEVLPLPAAGRPADFTGAVGRFELSAVVDRDELQVGESLKWTLRVRGQGNLEFLGLPEIGAVEGFHLLGSNENREGDVAEVTYDLTPLAATVDGLPGVSWSYFDTTPGVESYRELRTEPIPLRVAPLPESATLAAEGDADAAALVPGVDDIHDILTDAQLAELPAAPPASSGVRSGWLAVALPWLATLLVTLSWRRVRRRAGDRVGQRARRASGELRSGLQQGGSVDQLLAEYLAARLDLAAAAIASDPQLAERLVAAGCAAGPAERAAALLERASAARYGGAAAPTAAELLGVVDELDAQALQRQARGSAALALALLLAVPAAGAPVPGVPDAVVPLGTAPESAAVRQQDPASEVERAYRDGDHARAATLWRAALADGADPRLYYNLGNALFRGGEPAAALWAWECARPALPRDPRLLANIGLVERRLGVGGASLDESFLGALGELRAVLRPGEFLALCALLQLLAAGLWSAAWQRRRRGSGARPLRGAALLATLPALLIAIELLWLGPARAPRAVVLDGPRLAVRAEPGEQLDPVAELAPGVRVAVLGRGDRWTRVRLPSREGYVATARLGFLPRLGATPRPGG